VSWLSNLIIFELIRTWSDIGRDYSRHPVSRVIDYSDTIFTDRVRCLLLHPQSRILDLCSREIVQHLEPSLLTMISLFHPFRCIYRTKALLTSNFTSCWNVFCNRSCKDGSLQDHITKSSPLHWPALYILLDPRKLLPPDHPSTSTPKLQSYISGYLNRLFPPNQILIPESIFPEQWPAPISLRPPIHPHHLRYKRMGVGMSHQWWADQKDEWARRGMMIGIWWNIVSQREFYIPNHPS